MPKLTNSNTSETSKNVTLLPLKLTLNAFNASIHCLIERFTTTARINFSVFYHASRQPHLRIYQQAELAILFMTLREYLTFQTGKLQVLVSKSSRQNLKQNIQIVFTTRILNFGDSYWIIWFLQILPTLDFLISVSTKIGSRFSQSQSLDPGSVCRRCKVFSPKSKEPSKF